MQFLKSRRFAVIAMVAMMLIALLLGTSKAFSSMQQYVQTLFYDGTTGISKDLDDRINTAYNLTTVATRYLDSGDPAVAEVLAAREALTSASGVSEKYRANVRLTDATTALYEKLGTLPLSEQDAKYRRSLDADLRSSNEIISHSDYNLAAAEFNKGLSTFPASVLARLLGYRPIELFA